MARKLGPWTVYLRQLLALLAISMLGLPCWVNPHTQNPHRVQEVQRSLRRKGLPRARATPLAIELEPRDTPPLLNVPVYSLATLDSTGKTNMNIVTYACPVGIRPARAWCISLYRQTESHRNFVERRSGILQILGESHAPLVHLLGGQSSRDAGVDKAEGCRAKGFEWVSQADVQEMLLPGCKAYLSLALEGEITNAGDHDVAICRLDRMLYPVDSSCASVEASMSTDFLRAEGLISEAGRAVPPEP
mmetsp:Transcript_133220/g.414226  ORF Transcript_133220/g.414226 Transcript_133220/m.414226 type:complete len:247 (+) Transcript_133220:25-765(+)|eukprot:CAMPEP_0204594796 /NCGR_PEP_ID=MMETSP0661-20131031/52288_1 /ASSEMBLY_ACC=CAM_ASM_000606 /TAXON_ID=109239 /ORGANISM="Alexandrium margalefi, Strain AMGDE01CS-322" /LENGTH=246 /DNA_ID=CAMNT_0051605235 /DNA_START=25 /DNA_END=765 /DNA_ORIENTATION=-